VPGEGISPRDAARPDVGTTAGFARRVLFVCFVATLLLLAWKLSDVLLLLLFGAVIVATMLRSFAAPLQSRLGVSPRLAV